MITRTSITTLTAILIATFTLPFPSLRAKEETQEHPSTSSQVRLASWWFDRHAEKIAEIEKVRPTRVPWSVDLEWTKRWGLASIFCFCN